MKGKNGNERAVHRKVMKRIISTIERERRVIAVAVKPRRIVRVK